MNKVYIVLVNYNNVKDTIECLESVLKSHYSNFQIFVVDNSTDNSSINQLLAWANGTAKTVIDTSFPDLVYPLTDKPLNHIILADNGFNAGTNVYLEKLVIVKTSNNGFAAANNIALRYIAAIGDDSSLIWILNNDTVVRKDTLGNLASFYQHNVNGKFILSSKLMYYYRPHIIQAVAGYYDIWLGKHHHIGEGQQDTGQFDNYKFGEHDYIVGASIFLPKVFLQQVGLMCEDYFLYFEELDWINSGRSKGFDIRLVPDAVIYHKEGASIIGEKINKADTSIAEYYSITNRVRFIKKWYPWCLPTVMAGVMLALVKRIIQGKFALVKRASGTVFKILFEDNKPAIKR